MLVCACCCACASSVHLGLHAPALAPHKCSPQVVSGLLSGSPFAHKLQLTAGLPSELCKGPNLFGWTSDGAYSNGVQLLAASATALAATRVARDSGGVLPPSLAEWAQGFGKISAGHTAFASPRHRVLQMWKESAWSKTSYEDSAFFDKLFDVPTFNVGSYAQNTYSEWWRRMLTVTPKSQMAVLMVAESHHAKHRQRLTETTFRSLCARSDAIRATICSQRVFGGSRKPNRHCILGHHRLRWARHPQGQFDGATCNHHCRAADYAVRCVLPRDALRRIQARHSLSCSMPHGAAPSRSMPPFFKTRNLVVA